MPITRTIYTQGAINILSQNTGITATVLYNSGFGLFLNTVQSATFTANSPKQDVNAFGFLGAVNKVQVEPSTATLEVNLVVSTGEMGGVLIGATSGFWLSGLTADTTAAAPSGFVVTASGIGQVSGASLTSFRLEAAVGALPTLALTFDGISGAASFTAATAATTTVNTATIPITTPDSFGTVYWNTAAVGATGSGAGCPNTVRVAWEMPIERLNCLGNPISQPTIFSRPPGTLTFTAEGIDATMLNTSSFLTGVQIGPYKVTAANVKETSRTANMAVGEAASTYSVTSEVVALSANISG